MKLVIFIACAGAALCLQSCGGSLIKHKDEPLDQTSQVTSKSKIPVPDANNNLVVQDEKDLIGYWVGSFDYYIPDEKEDTVVDDGGQGSVDKINISIDKIDGDKVKGHAVIAGKVHFFDCTLEKQGEKYLFNFKGGSDEKSTGWYRFGIAPGDSLMKGKWNPLRDSVPGHIFSLTKKLFAYNPDWKLNGEQYVNFRKSVTIPQREDTTTYDQEMYASTSDALTKYNPSAQLLTKDEIANLKKADLLILRNSIFARHGYTFKKPLLSIYFSQQSWYVPLSTNVTAELTDIEKKNLKLMRPYEKNAEEYYGGYGR